MIDIAQHIEYLLMRHDCVVVPGLGAFLVNDEPARYVAETHSFLPPSRTIGFNPEVRHNDALLSGSISRRERVSLEAARNRLDMEVASLRCQLDVCGEVPIGNLGLLVRGDSPEYPVFEPSECSLPVSRYSYFNVVDAELIRQDDENLCEELGDLLLQVVMHAQIAAEENRFTIEDVVRGVNEKMIRRHPHVFGEATVSSVEEGLSLWEQIKKQEKQGKG